MRDFEISVETIMPDEAREYLREVEENRIGSENPVIARLTEALSTGGWIPNGDAIVFNGDEVIDGLKRLAACVYADTPIVTVVVRGVDEDAALTLGTHRKRRLNDYFKILEIENHSLISRVVNSIPSFAKGTFTTRKPPHHTQAISIYEHNEEEIRTSVNAVTSGRRWMDYGYNVALWYFILSRVDAEEAHRFITDAFEEGDKEHLDREDPARALYNRLYKERNEYGMKLRKREKAALVIHAWNMRREGRSVKVLRWSEAGNMAFPVISGWTERADIEMGKGSFDLDMADEGIVEDMEAEAVLITPEMAAEFLERNLPNNRSQVEGTIRNYARDMSSGAWTRNGQAIKFDAEGVLIDGQHRLRACIMANTPFWSVVVHNVPRNAFLTYDDQPGRRFSDILTERGVKYATLVGALVDRMLRWDTGRYEQNFTATVAEQNEYLTANPHLVDLIRGEVGAYIREPERKGGAKLFRPSAANMAYAMMHRVDPERAGEFMVKAVMGGPEPQIQALRNFVFNLRQQKRVHTGTEGEFQELFALIKTWNAWVSGKDINPRAFARNEGEAIPAPRVPDPRESAPEPEAVAAEEPAFVPSASFLAR